jgi:CBS domain containing-hemolysin-like protein
VSLPEGEWQTVAGYVIDAVDEIPAAGDRVDTEVGEFEVVEMDGYAIERLRVRLAVRDRSGAPAGELDDQLDDQPGDRSDRRNGG